MNNKYVKSTLVVLLAGSVTFSPILSVKAQENNETRVTPEQTEELDSATLDESLFEDTLPSADTEENSASKDTIVDETVTGEGEHSEDVAEVSLIPGDFFYFAKIMLEKIRLAFTMDDEKQAELLAQFANERLNEAQVLLAKEKEDEAIDTIKEAIENMAELEETTEEAGQIDNEIVEETDASEEEIDTVETDLTNEIEKNEETVEDTDNDLLANNIIALTKAMEQVKNPTAKAALQKNIEKSYVKLAAKIEKINKKTGKQQENGTEEIIESTPDALPEAEGASPDNSATATSQTESQTVNPASKTIESSSNQSSTVEQSSPVVDTNSTSQTNEVKVEKQAEKIEKQQINQSKQAEKASEKVEKQTNKANDKKGNTNKGNSNK